MDELIVNNSTLIVVGAMALFYFHVQSDGVTPLVEQMLSQPTGAATRRMRRGGALQYTED